MNTICIYPEYKQEKANIKPLKEEDAYPALPQDAYGWEKLMSEITLKHYGVDHKMKIRIATNMMFKITDGIHILLYNLVICLELEQFTKTNSTCLIVLILRALI